MIESKNTKGENTLDDRETSAKRRTSAKARQPRAKGAEDFEPAPMFSFSFQRHSTKRPGIAHLPRGRAKGCRLWGDIFTVSPESVGLGTK